MATHLHRRSASSLAQTKIRVQQVPPQLFFAVSAIFHYLGPACAVLLFAAVAPLGVAWLRILSAAVVFAVIRRPWRIRHHVSANQWREIIAFGFVLAAMNACFYLAIARLPLANVGAIEFLGPIALAAFGVRNGRNVAALAITVFGVALLTRFHLVDAPLANLFAVANSALFVLYIVLGHRLAKDGAVDGIDRLAIAMIVAAFLAAPFGAGDVGPVFAHPVLLLAAIGVGISSSVIPYVTDQLAMARLPRATFALMLALLPAVATAIGVVVLRQLPSPVELAGIALVMAGVALHRPNQGAHE